MGKAAALFYSEREDTLYGRVTPTTEQREFLQEQWNALAEYLKAELQKHGFPISTWLQGSYKFGTLIKPVHKGEEYDVDVGVYFEWEEDGDAKPAAKQLRDWVQTALITYKGLTTELKDVADPPKERCSRAVYEKQFHIDTPVYHLLGSRDKRRLACWSNKWELSDPKAIYKWFKTSVSEDDRDQLRRVIRYLKGWAAVGFQDAPEARPSSVLLSVLVAQAFADTYILPFFRDDDEDCLTNLIKKIHDRLAADRRVRNPVDKAEDLNRLTAEGFDAFLVRLAALQDCAEKAAEAEDEAAAALAWSEALSFLMPLPEAEQVEILEKASGKAVMQLPEIDIEVYARDPERLVNRYRNEVPSVPKDCDLIFRIANPHVLPPLSTVEWTVRNQGLEADSIGDLGHRRVGVGQTVAEEQTAYTGRHFMDCVVRSNGQVYAVRRVPVNIIDLRYPPRNPKRPAYAKLQSFIRRRR